MHNPTLAKGCRPWGWRHREPAADDTIPPVYEGDHSTRRIGPNGIPLPAVGAERAHERDALRRQRIGGLIGIPVWIAVGILGLVFHHRSNLTGLITPVLWLGVFVVGTSANRRSVRRRASSIAAIPGGEENPLWSGEASIGPTSAFELRNGGTEGGFGRLTVQLGALGWIPDGPSASSGHRSWRLSTHEVVEAEVSGGHFGLGLRLVRPGRAFPVLVQLSSTTGLAEALRSAGFTVGS